MKIQPTKRSYEGLSLAGLEAQIASVIATYAAGASTSNDAKYIITRILQVYDGLLEDEDIANTYFCSTKLVLGEPFRTEHVIPRSCLVEWLLNGEPPGQKEVSDFLREWLVIAYITIEEDARLNRFYVDKMPSDFYVEGHKLHHKNWRAIWTGRLGLSWFLVLVALCGRNEIALHRNGEPLYRYGYTY